MKISELDKQSISTWLAQPLTRRECHALLAASQSSHGHYQTLEEIADAENINPSYVSRLPRMTPLAPVIVEMILAGRQPDGLTMARAMQPFPVESASQPGSFRE